MEDAETTRESRINSRLTPSVHDPNPLSPDDLKLPPTVVDTASLWNPIVLWQFIKKTLGYNLGKVSLPEGLDRQFKIPSYALVEFHNLPNGYYSKFFSMGYGNGFEAAMLGEMKRIRQEIAEELLGCYSVLDLGCGVGSSTLSLHKTGIPDTWGLDPSPYLLSMAAQLYPEIKFVQGSAEETGFSKERFDGISACWLFHEMPARYADIALKECRRILRPGGKLVIAEPSKYQHQGRRFELFKKYGFKGLYFNWLSHFVFEPYVKTWQAKEIKPWLESNGFTLLKNKFSMPEHQIVARKA